MYGQDAPASKRKATAKAKAPIKQHSAFRPKSSLHGQEGTYFCALLALVNAKHTPKKTQHPVAHSLSKKPNHEPNACYDN